MEMCGVSNSIAREEANDRRRSEENPWTGAPSARRWILHPQLWVGRNADAELFWGGPLSRFPPHWNGNLLSARAGHVQRDALPQLGRDFPFLRRRRGRDAATPRRPE